MNIFEAEAIIYFTKKFHTILWYATQGMAI